MIYFIVSNCDNLIYKYTKCVVILNIKCLIQKYKKDKDKDKIKNQNIIYKIYFQKKFHKSKIEYKTSFIFS